MWKRSIKLVKVSEKGHKKTNDFIVSEISIRLFINGHEKAYFVATPQFAQELIIGYLSSKLITVHPHDVHIENGECHIELAENEPNIETPHYGAPQSIRLNHDQISSLVARFQEKAILYKDTSITHTAALASPNELIAAAEDIDELNAIYKVLGQQEKKSGIAPILITTSKINSLLVDISLQQGITCIISRFAPTDSALDRAAECDMIILGFARGRQFNIYTGNQYINY